MASRILTRVLRNPIAWYALPLTLSLMVLFALAYDQGQILSTLVGDTSQRLTWLHEFFHDIRHAAGFPCH